MSSKFDQIIHSIWANLCYFWQCNEFIVPSI